MEIILVTENEEKFRVAKKSLEGLGITIIKEKLDVPEIQAKDSKEIVEYSAKYAANILGKPILKTDVAWHIKALNGFPGPFTKYVNEWLGAEGYLKLMQGKKNREVEIIEYLAYCEPNSEPIIFCGRTTGIISEKARGNRGSVLDKIFIPKGKKMTAAELSENKMAELWAENLNHWLEFKEFIKNPNALCFRIKKNTFPEIQLLDKETINWIKIKTRAKRITIKKIFPKFQKIPWKKLIEFIPEKEDYLKKETYHSIHGITHTLRTIILSAILCQINKISEEDEKSILMAAKIHDTKRINDNKDKEHGIRAVKNAPNQLSKEIVKYHNSTESIKIISKHLNEINLFKTADALDRYRLPKEEWFPKEELLTHQGKKLLPLSKYLVCKSEEINLETKNPINAVKKTAIDLGIIYD